MIEYWELRKKGLRGQGEVIRTVLHPKGTAIKHINREGAETEYANASGENMVRTGGGYTRMNRQQQRQKTVARYYAPDKKVTIMKNGKRVVETVKDYVGKKFTQTGVYHKPSENKKEQ